MQSYASAVWHRSSWSILFFDMEEPGLPPPRIFMVGLEAIRIRPLKFGVQCSRSVCGFQNDAFGHFAEGDEFPQGDQQLSGQRDDHRLADASSSVLRSRPIQAGQFAIRLEHQEPPGELDHSVSNARVACSGQPFLAAFYATFLRRSRQACGKACNRVPQRGGIGDQVGSALICCRNSFSSSNDGTASRVDLRREDRAGPAAAPPNCPSVPQWVRIER